MTPFSKLSRSKSRNQGGMAHLIILLLLALGLILGGYYLLSSTGEDGKTEFSAEKIINKVNITPIGKLKSSLEKTESVDTLYAEFEADLESKVTFTQTGVTQSIPVDMGGYITGSTDGEISKVKLSIKQFNNPSASVDIEIVGTENNVYLKGPATTGKWWRFSEEKFKEEDSKNPTDASLFIFDILGTIFEDNKALLKSVNDDSFEDLGTEQGENKKFNKYHVEIAVPDYISNLENDDELSSEKINQVKAILNDATISATFYVSDSSGYVEKVTIDAKNLTQIPTDESKALGVSTTHDAVLTAELSRFNVPTSITAPSGEDVIDVDSLE
ncbi:hypothetical protein ACFL2C_01760 [Patescibacteria group bacterium]